MPGGKEIIKYDIYTKALIESGFESVHSYEIQLARRHLKMAICHEVGLAGDKNETENDAQKTEETEEGYDILFCATKMIKWPIPNQQKSWNF